MTARQEGTVALNLPSRSLVTQEPWRWLVVAGVFAVPFVPPPSWLAPHGFPLPDLVLVAPIVLGLWTNMTARLRPAQITSLLIFISLISISVLRSDDIDYSLSFLARMLFAILVGLVLAPHLGAGVLILATMARVAVELAAHLVQTGFWPPLSTKLGDAGSHHLVVAGLLLPVTVIAASRGGLGGSLGVLFGTLAIILTRSRAALLALGIGLAVDAWTQQRTRIRRRWAVALGSLAIAIAAALMISMTWGDALRSMEPRAAYSRAALEATAGHPWLGLGWGGFMSEARARDIDPVAIDPHNLFLHVAVEAGVPALVSLIALLLSLRAAAPACPAMLAIAVYSLFASFYLDWPIFWMLLFSGAMRSE